MEPQRAAVDLLGELTEVAAAEDAAGRVLRGARRSLVGGAERRTLLDRFRCHAAVSA